MVCLSDVATGTPIPLVLTAYWKSLLVHPAHEAASVSLDRCSKVHIHYWLGLVRAAGFFQPVVFTATDHYCGNHRRERND